MNINDIIDVDIMSSGMSGEGVARVDGKVVFVPYTLSGERVRARVRQIKRKYINASAIKILDPSPHRKAPDCPHYFRCGGCDMRHVTADYRRDVLIEELKNNFAKIAGIEAPEIEFVESEFGRRNKIAMPFGSVDGKVVVGMYRFNSHVVEPVDCRMAGTLTRRVVSVVTHFVNAEHLPVYDENDGRGLLRHLVVREIGDRASATVVINGDGLGKCLEQKLAGLLPENVDFFVCPNTRKGNVVMGERVRLVKGNERMTVDVCGVRAELSPLSFFQVNDFIRDKLYADAVSYISSNTLVDLYSGIGVMSNIAARKCERVFAVELVPQAIVDADRTATINGNAQKIKNVCGSVEEVLPKLIAQKLLSRRLCDVIVDPPRKGCGESVMRSIADIEPKRLVYISCNHATMCRDLRLFLDGSGKKGDKYSIVEAKLYDMFENSHHAETLVVLEREQDNSHRI